MIPPGWCWYVKGLAWIVPFALKSLQMQFLKKILVSSILGILRTVSLNCITFAESSTCSQKVNPPFSHKNN